MSPTSSRGVVVACAAVLAIGLAARLTTWQEVFTPRGVRLLVDTDPHYHVLRAERILVGTTADIWFDQGLNHPAGANIAWPPGFDAIIAGMTRLLHGSSATRSDLEHVAVFVPVVIGVLALLVQMAIARRWIGPGGAILAGVLGALLPIQVQYSALGVVDQHIAEQLGVCVAVLGFSMCSSRRHTGPFLIALALAAGPWIWQGSTLTVGFVVLTAIVVFVVRPEGDDSALQRVRGTALGCAMGGVVLALSLLVWGPPAAFRAAGLNGLSWVHPLSTLSAAVGLAALARFGRWHPDASRFQRAIAGAVVCAAVGGAVFSVVPHAVLHGLRSLRATDPWLRSIAEFQPAFFGSMNSFQDDAAWTFWAVGPVIAAPLLGVGALRRKWAQAPEARTGLVILMVGTVVFVGLFLARSRFVLYAAPFVVWWGALFTSDAIARTRTQLHWRPAAAVVAAATFLTPTVELFRSPFDSAFDESLIDLLAWVRTHGGHPRGILASWALGHVVQYYADAPAVVTPFGTDIGDDGMRRQAAFLYARTIERAEQVLHDAEVGYVLLGDSFGELANAIAFAPPDAVPLLESTHDYWRSRLRVTTLPSYDFSMPGWLYEHDGAPPQFGGTSGVGFLRLAYETRAPSPLKLFERVQGARVLVHGAAPYEDVAAYVEVVTNLGRRFRWWTSAAADGDGVASLRVPYATGQNGASVGSICIVRAGAQMQNVIVPPSAVVGGGFVEVGFRPRVPARSR